MFTTCPCCPISGQLNELKNKGVTVTVTLFHHYLANNQMKMEPNLKQFKPDIVLIQCLWAYKQVMVFDGWAVSRAVADNETCSQWIRDFRSQVAGDSSVPSIIIPLLLDSRVCVYIGKYFDHWFIIQVISSQNGNHDLVPASQLWGFAALFMWQ